MTRKPKNAARTADKAKQREALGAAVLEQSPELQEMIDDLDAPKASNAILASEKPKPKGTLSLPKRPGAKASEKPTEAATAKEAKSATPTPKKPKAQPVKAPEPPKWQPPKGSEEIKRDGQTVGYLVMDDKGLYDAFDVEGKSRAIGSKPEATKANFLKRIDPNR